VARRGGARWPHLQRGVVDALKEVDEAGHDASLDDFLDGRALLCGRGKGGA